MATRFAYRALQADGTIGSGTVEASDPAAAIASLRRAGARPIAVEPMAAGKQSGRTRVSARSREGTVAFVTELAALLKAGLPLDRSLALAIGNVEDGFLAAELRELFEDVRAGKPLSAAMMRRSAIFSPACAAMAEAGEANGALGDALARLADMLERGEELRKLLGNAMIYPVSLAVVATGVILLMLLFVVPQFESLFDQAGDRLPAASRFVMAASKLLREWGWWLLGGLLIGVLGLRQILALPEVAQARDRAVMSVPQLGELVRYVECARFARTLGVLVDGNVALHHALLLARRTVANRVVGEAIERTAGGVREGSGLSGPLAEAGVLPRLAIGFLRTGEETSQLGPMLNCLADMLDRDVRTRIERLIGIATPMITVLLGATVAAIIAAIMSAIIGFNDLALSS